MTVGWTAGSAAGLAASLRPGSETGGGSGGLLQRILAIDRDALRLCFRFLTQRDEAGQCSLQHGERRFRVLVTEFGVEVAQAILQLRHGRIDKVELANEAGVRRDR